jgi:prevent-host-death family protein
VKAVDITELKDHLSDYLKAASRGARIVINDRNEPVAELGPAQVSALPWHERLARQERLRLGTQKWETLRVETADHQADIQTSLQAVREDPREIRRR